MGFWSFTAGNLAEIATIVIGGLKLYNMLTKVIYQHELMWRDYSIKHGLIAEPVKSMTAVAGQ